MSESNERQDKEIKCPFCGATNHIEIEKKDKIIFPHPPAPFIHKGEERKLSKNILEFWKHKHYEGEREKYLTCWLCGYRFHVFLSPVPKDQYDEESKYFAELSEGRETEEKRLFIEKILDLIERKFHLPRLLGCLAIVLFLELLWAVSVIICGGLPKLVHDWQIMIIIGAVTAMFYFTDCHFKNIRAGFAPEKLPIESKMNLFLSEKYKEVILGNPFKRRLYPTTMGIVSVVTINIFNLFFWPLLHEKGLLIAYETPYEGLPIIYTSYLQTIFGGLLFWGIFVFFLLGVSLWAAICTAAVINQIGKGARLKINLLKDSERLEELGRLSLSSLLPLISAAVIIPFGAMWFIAVGVIQAIIIMIVTYSLFVFSIVFLFLFALFPLHQVLKEEKKEKLNQISKELSEIDGKTLKGEEISTNDLLRAQNLRAMYSKIYSISEWPFKAGTILKLTLYNVIPAVSLFVNIKMLIP